MVMILESIPPHKNLLLKQFKDAHNDFGYKFETLSK